MKKLFYSSCLLALAAANLHAAVLFSDTFTYGDGALAGQGTWLQNGGTATPAVQVNSGRAVLGTSGQDVNAAMTGGPFALVDGTTFYIGATINLSAATAGGDYFLHWSPANGSSVFISRLHAKSSGAGFQLGYLETSGTGGTLTYGTTVLNFNQDYRMVVAYNVVAGTVNDTANVYVDPIDYAVEGNNTAYLSDTWNSVTGETVTLGAINIRQGGATSAPTLSIDNLVVGTALADMQVAVPEPSSAALIGLGLLALGFVRRRN
jgi:hypothetical protein